MAESLIKKWLKAKKEKRVLPEGRGLKEKLPME